MAQNESKHFVVEQLGDTGKGVGRIYRLKGKFMYGDERLSKTEKESYFTVYLIDGQIMIDDGTAFDLPVDVFMELAALIKQDWDALRPILAKMPGEV